MPTNNELNEACLVCGNSTLDVKFPAEKSLNDFIHYIKTDKGLFQFYHSPTLMWDDEDEEEEEHGIYSFYVSLFLLYLILHYLSLIRFLSHSLFLTFLRLYVHLFPKR